MFKKILFIVFMFNFNHCQGMDCFDTDTNEDVLNKLQAAIEINRESGKNLTSLSAAECLENVKKVLEGSQRSALITQLNEMEITGSYDESAQKLIHQITEILLRLEKNK